MTVSLTDALTGVDFKVKHIDGTDIRVSSEEGEVIAPGSKKIVEGKGLPFYQRPYEYGNLVLEFSVEFPKTISKPQLTELKAVLNKLENDDDEISMFDEPVLLKRYSSTQANTDERGGK